MASKTALGAATGFALKWGEMAFLAPLVFWGHSLELGRTAARGGNVQPRLARLAAEKQKAALDGAFDAAKTATRLTAAAAKEGLYDVAIPFSLATAAVEPARRRVRANARRLARGA